MKFSQRFFLRKWIAALRSGKYHQTDGQLCKVQKGQAKHCCLGVLCRVLTKNGVNITAMRETSNTVGFEYQGDDNNSTLPSSIRQLVGLDDITETNLISMNDDGTSFRKIADYIEKEFGL